MKHLKKFNESTKKSNYDFIVEYRDDMIKKISKYFDEYESDSTKMDFDRILELIWLSDETTNIFENQLDCQITPNLIDRIIQDSLDSYTDRQRRDLLELYYDIHNIMKESPSNDQIETVKDIFSEYYDISYLDVKVKISSVSDTSLKKIIVDITSTDINKTVLDDVNLPSIYKRSYDLLNPVGFEYLGDMVRLKITICI